MVVSGPPADDGHLGSGLQLVLDLLQARGGVLFSLHPHGVRFHVACGAESARVAARMSQAADMLHREIQGPTVIAPPRRVRGDLDGPVLVESAGWEVVLLGERVHRDVAYGLAILPRNGLEPVSATHLRFAHSIFRDLCRLAGERTPERTRPQRMRERWQRFQFAGLVGGTPHMRTMFRTIRKLAECDVNVLVLGESGTGKELVARAIHQSGRFAGQRFVAQNCAALPEALLESELFGHCRGAFTGAQADKKGLFEEADGGTFFLDEIADMPIPLQIKMLRVLQDGEIRRLGETRVRSVRVRVVAATNKVLAHEVAQGRFREDLFHRLNVVKLELPPLRRRREDVPLLATYFADKICARLGRPRLQFADEVLQRFSEYDWPGNVRELENEVARLVALHGDDGEVRSYMLSERLRYGSSVDWSLGKLEEIHELHQATEYLERALIARSLERHGWNKSRAAGELGVSRQGLIKKIKRLGLVRPGTRAESVPAGGAEQLKLPFDDGVALPHVAEV